MEKQDYLWIYPTADSVGSVKYDNGVFQRLFFYESGNIVYQIHFDSTGHRIIERRFRDNRVQETWYYPSGALSLVHFAESGESVGKVISWYESGAVEAITDAWEGSNTEYYEDGTIRCLGNSGAGGREDSLWTWWDRDGNVIREILYNMGDTVEDRIIDSAAVVQLE